MCAKLLIAKGNSCWTIKMYYIFSKYHSVNSQYTKAQSSVQLKLHRMVPSQPSVILYSLYF